MRLILSTLFVVSLLFLGARASAKDGPPPPPPQPKHAPEPPQPPPGPPSPHTGPQPPSAPRPEADPERRKELRRRIQAMRMARLTQILDLDDATAAKLFPALNRHDEQVAALAEERGGLFGKIEAALRS
ncbi:hypothetical protein HY251_07700, partial [bacterium]|nr:hypothetical protein [bacterium]